MFHSDSCNVTVELREPHHVRTRELLRVFFQDEGDTNLAECVSQLELQDDVSSPRQCRFPAALVAAMECEEIPHYVTRPANSPCELRLGGRAWVKVRPHMRRSMLGELRRALTTLGTPYIGTIANDREILVPAEHIGCLRPPCCVRIELPHCVQQVVAVRASA